MTGGLPDTGRADLGLIRALTEEISGVLDPILPPGTPCALLDFPDHPNVGDSAIWLGEKAFLRRADLRIAYTCDSETYSRAALASRLPAGTILLSGGGNLGDLYPEAQRFRERVVAEFPRHRVVQLAQAIHFRRPENLRRAREVFNGHPDLVLLVRDARSLDLARNEFTARSALCPDMAFALGPLLRAAPARTRILWLRRQDEEAAAAGRQLPKFDGEEADWAAEAPSLTRRVRAWAVRHRTRHPRVLRHLAVIAVLSSDRVARERLARGCAMLERGRVVITDRLHGHVLCLLLGIPHVLMDNNYGKVRAFYETWTKRAELAAWAESPEEALALAQAMSDGLV